jgi:hypothetical protein
MAMIFDIGIPQGEAAAIGNYLASDGEAGIPEVGEEGQKVLDAVTQPRDPNSLWRTVIGRFVEYEPTGTGAFRSPEGEVVKVTDTFMNEEGSETKRRGVVVADHEDPEAAYVIGVPM